MAETTASSDSNSAAAEPHVLLGEVSERLAPKIEEAQAQLGVLNGRIKGFIRQNPGAVLLGAAGLGFIVGRLASRK